MRNSMIYVTSCTLISFYYRKLHTNGERLSIEVKNSDYALISENMCNDYACISLILHLDVANKIKSQIHMNYLDTKLN